MSSDAIERTGLRGRLFKLVAGALLAVGASGVVWGMRAVPAVEQEWPMHGRDAGEQRFSPLDKVTPANVGQLGAEWVLKGTGDFKPAAA